MCVRVVVGGIVTVHHWQHVGLTLPFIISTLVIVGTDPVSYLQKSLQDLSMLTGFPAI